MSRNFVLLLAPMLILLAVSAGCSSLKSSSSGSIRDNDAIAIMLKDQRPESEPKKVVPISAQSAADIENMTIDEVIRGEGPNTQSLYDDSRYDFPITVNSKVEGWIDYFTGRGRHHMERYLARSSRYLPRMREIFRKAGLPEDLVYLALIESGFNLRAKSRAKAVGPWQFMKATGKRYGLRVDSWIDERRDPIRSTEAAAAYLKDLYLMFESWYLAASAYNAGEYKILRAIEELKTNNYWRISQTRFIRRETKDYIPKLIAAAIIGKNPKKYKFDEITYQEPLQYDLVSIDFPVRLKELAIASDTPEDDMLDLNPGFLKAVIPPGGAAFDVRVPVGSKVLLERKVASMQKSGIVADLPRQHPVKNGETLASISAKYSVGIRELANANNLSTREKVPPGTQLIIPNRVASLRKPSAVSAKRPVEVVKVEQGDIVHVVQRGESLWSISEKYDVTIQNIFRWNNLKRSQIFPGRKLRIRTESNAKAEPSSSAPKPHTSNHS